MFPFGEKVHQQQGQKMEIGKWKIGIQKWKGRRI
jgi:hypothetical protein